MVYPQAVRHDRGRLGMASTRLYHRLNEWLDRNVAPIEAPLATGFVVGCGNSGTTLVAARLGNHPQVFVIPHETGLFRPSRRLGRARWQVLDWMAKARASGASVMLEKTPKHVHAAARIRRLLPEARMIVVLRNPYDTCLSLKKRFGSLDFAIDRWQIDNAAALGLRDEPRAAFVRYERLTVEPEAELARLLAFLGLAWDPAVLAEGGTAYDTEKQRHRTMRLRAEQVRQPIRPNTGQWRRELAVDEIARIAAATGPLWSALGGDPDGDGYLD